MYSELESSPTTTSKPFSTTQPYFEGFFDLATGPSQNVDPSPLANGFIIQQTGIYYVSFDLVFNRTVGGNNYIYEVAGFINGIENPNSLNLSSRRYGDQTNATLTAIGSIQSDIFDIRI